MLGKYFSFEQKKKNSECRVCGDKGVETKMLWYKNNWSRGDDDYLGKVCGKCRNKLNIGEFDVHFDNKENKWVFIQSLTNKEVNNLKKE